MNIKNFLRPGKGASDITPLLADSKAFAYAIDELANQFDSGNIDMVAAVEGRGFIFGAGVAYKMQKGLVLIRKAGKLKNAVYSRSYTDYTGKEQILEIHQDNLAEGARVLIIDDWIESGGTVKAAITLVKQCKARVVGIGALIDDSSDELKQELAEYNYKFLDKTSKGDNF